MSLLDKLTPKAIIFNALKEKLEPEGILKLNLFFNVKNDTYNIAFISKEQKSIKLNIDENEVSVLKKVLVNNIKKKIDQEFTKDYNIIILIIDIKNENIEIWIEDIFKNVHPFKF